ncbi:hypothetical protein DFH06DRAFT_1400031, partial [Mycena polygramma]
MPTLRQSLATLTSYRFGYSPQRPYPWRWSTPLALIILLTSTALLTCLNIPLSAYETVQEFTYFPNATLPKLPMSSMIPSFLRGPTAGFAPQTLHVGDSFRLNNSLFSYKIVNAFDAEDNRRPVSSFPYYNNPFSNNCDVTNITATVTRELGEAPIPYQYYGHDVSGFVTCTRPTVFQMTWGLPVVQSANALFSVDRFGLDLREALYYGVMGDEESPSGAATIIVTVRPCCNCTGSITTTAAVALEAESANLLEPPCSTAPTRFIGLTGNVQNTTADNGPWGFPYNWNGSDLTDLFAGLDPDLRVGYIGTHDLSALDAPFHNLFQVFYHLVRYDLGAILENQIYSLPEMFNRSIVTVRVPEDMLGNSGSPFDPVTPSAANTMRIATSNETLMTQWQNVIGALNETDRMPVLEYLRPVPRLKPLGSAITSVFVSTFAMIRTPLHQEKHLYNQNPSGGIKGPTDRDDRLNNIPERLAVLMKRMDRMENTYLRDTKRDAMDELGTVESGEEEE